MLRYLVFGTLLVVSNARADIQVVRVGSNDLDDVSGSGTLDSVVSAAADYWNALLNGKVNLTVEYRAGSTILGDPGEHFPLLNQITFKQDAPWFADSSPFDHSEFAIDTLAAGQDFGGGFLTSSRTLGQRSAETISRLDLFTIALHELGHAIAFDGISGGGINVSKGAFAGSMFAVDGDDHFSLDPADGVDNTLMAGAPSPGQRILPSAVDIVALEELTNLHGQFDRQAVYMVGDVVANNTAVSPPGKDVFNPATIEVAPADHPVRASGVMWTSLERTEFVGYITVGENGFIQVLDGGLATFDITMYSATLSLEEGAYLQSRGIEANGSTIAVDGTLALLPTSVFQPPREIALFDSALTMSGDQSLVRLARGLLLLKDGSRLLGDGTVEGESRVDTGSTISPGRSAGLITFDGNLSVGDATFIFEDFGTEADKVIVVDTLTLSADSRFEIHLFEPRTSIDVADYLMFGDLSIADGFSLSDAIRISTLR